jgi:hypothetical protein
MRTSDLRHPDEDGIAEAAYAAALADPMCDVEWNWYFSVVMMYVRYPLSLRNVENLLAERGIWRFSFASPTRGIIIRTRCR